MAPVGYEARVIDRATPRTRPGRIHPDRLDWVPRPASGATWERWRTLAAIAADDLVTARLVEGHLDARAIIAELEPHRPLDEDRLGVWAAEAPRGGLRATPDGDGWVLDGNRRWCSGAHEVTTALVTAHAPDGLRLFLLPCDDPGVAPVPGTWPAVGMAASDSLEIRVEGVRVGADAAVGGPGDYLDRPGFWHGAMGVAACWFGGAIGVGRLLRAQTCDSTDPHRLAHLGAVDAVLVDDGRPPPHRGRRDRRRPPRRARPRRAPRPPGAGHRGGRVRRGARPGPDGRPAPPRSASTPTTPAASPTSRCTCASPTPRPTSPGSAR